MGEKRLINFPETLHTLSTPKVIFFILWKKCENFLMGLKSIRNEEKNVLLVISDFMYL